MSAFDVKYKENRPHFLCYNTFSMPNSLTHYLFAKANVLDSKEHLDATYVGAQGPDPFFFYGTLCPLFRPHHHDVNAFGGVTQHRDLVLPYEAMMRYAYKSPDKELLFAYIDGLFMHYVVDCACHPFIFYRTGYTDRPEDSVAIHRHYNFSHMSLEVIIDFILSHRENQFQRIDKVLKLSNQDLRKISRMWYEMNVEVQHLPHVHPKSYYYALKDFRFTEKHGWDKTGRKKALAKVIFGKESLGYGMIFPQNLDAFKGIDFLNESHAPWRMPTGEVRTESFEDLLEIAKRRYHELHAVLLQAKAGEDVRSALNAIVGGLNHEGIIPDSPKLYWKLIWPKEYLVDYPGCSSL
jgi:hypothetical protein